MMKDNTAKLGEEFGNKRDFVQSSVEKNAIAEE